MDENKQLPGLIGPEESTRILGALKRGLPNLEHHIANVRQFGMQLVVAINRFGTDTDAELEMVREAAVAAGARVALCDVFAKGGEGGEALAREVLALLEEGKSHYKPLYDTALPIREKIDTIVRKVYGGDGADYSSKADKQIAYLESVGLGDTPVCMAKTQYSISHDASLKGAPSGFTVPIREIRLSAGAGFITPLCGEMRTMPGLPSRPGGENIDIDADGRVVGLF